MDNETNRLRSTLQPAQNLSINLVYKSRLFDKCLYSNVLENLRIKKVKTASLSSRGLLQV